MSMTGTGTSGDAADARSGVVYGRYQGARRRSLVLSIVGLFLVAIVADSWFRRGPSLVQVAITIVVVMAVLGLSEWALVRRVGLEIRPDALVLRGAVRRVEIPWNRVQGFVWQEGWSLTKTQYLYVETDQPNPRRIPKDAPIRLPTVARTVIRDRPNDRFLGALLTSPNLRSTTGIEVDATELLERVRYSIQEHSLRPVARIELRP
jgi:hypothetical protein